jgi:hypothetical protein
MDMHTVELSNKQFLIPTTWDEITVERQLQVEELVRGNPDFKSLAIIAGYSDTPIGELKRMNFGHVKELFKHFAFVNEQLPADPIEHFEHNGNTYNVMPTLLKGESQDFISLETLLWDYKSNLYKALPRIIAILAKREGETLGSYDIKERSKEFESLPMTTAHRLYVFFCLSESLSKIDSHKILEVKNQELIESLKSMKNILKKRDGMGLSIRWQKAKLLTYLKFIELRWKKRYSGCISETRKTS